MALQPCDQLDYETPLYQSCGTTELSSITTIAGILWLPQSALIGIFVLDGIHALFLGFAIFVAGTIASVVCLAKAIKKIKAGKPEGWYARAFFCILCKHYDLDLIYKSGRWSTERGI